LHFGIILKIHGLMNIKYIEDTWSYEYQIYWRYMVLWISNILNIHGLMNIKYRKALCCDSWVWKVIKLGGFEKTALFYVV
jgi:hypothetical protein